MNHFVFHFVSSVSQFFRRCGRKRVECTPRYNRAMFGSWYMRPARRRIQSRIVLHAALCISTISALPSNTHPLRQKKNTWSRCGYRRIIMCCVSNRPLTITGKVWTRFFVRCVRCLCVWTANGILYFFFFLSFSFCTANALWMALACRFMHLYIAVSSESFARTQEYCTFLRVSSCFEPCTMATNGGR